MKHAPLVTALVGGIVTVAAASAAMAAPVRSEARLGGPPCTPKLTRIQGHQTAVNCGPATATLRIGGRTYTFHDGFCQQSKSAGAALKLDLGTTVVGVRGNAGRPDFSMLVGKNHFLASMFHADYGGRRILGDTLIDVRGNVPSRGTFASRLGPKFTGTWDCHGVVWQGP
jgi:hypothetical protein